MEHGYHLDMSWQTHVDQGEIKCHGMKELTECGGNELPPVNKETQQVWCATLHHCNGTDA